MKILMKIGCNFFYSKIGYIRKLFYSQFTANFKRAVNFSLILVNFSCKFFLQPNFLVKIWWKLAVFFFTANRLGTVADIKSMLWAVPVCFWKRYALGSTSMFWAVPVWSGQYRYALCSTGTAQSIPVLKPSRYCPEHTSTAQSIPVLSRAYRYCQVFHLPDCLWPKAAWFHTPPQYIFGNFP